MHLVLAIENTAFSLCDSYTTQTEHSNQQATGGVFQSPSNIIIPR